LACSAEYGQAYRAASKEAVAYLHELTEEMNDPQAKAVLNTAAFSLGATLRAHATALQDKADLE